MGKVGKWLEELGENGAEKLAELVDEGRQIKARIRARYWKTPQSGVGFVYPEQNDPRLMAKADFGVAFSGGGTRSMSLCLGQMRSLRAMGLDKHIRYIGAISGGSWFSVPYTYLPNAVDEEAWLGRYTPPEALNWSVANSFFKPKSGILAGQIARSELALRGIKDIALSALTGPGFNIPWIKMDIGLIDRDELFSKLLETVFLDEIGLGESRYPAWDNSDVSAIIRRHAEQRFNNPKLDRSDFQIVERDRPFLIVNGAMHHEAGVTQSGDRFNVSDVTGLLSYEHYEFTPIYHGIQNHSVGKMGHRIGGGYIENIGFDTWLPIYKGEKGNQHEMAVTPAMKQHRLTLRDIIGTSGAAPAIAGDLAARVAGQNPVKTSPLEVFPSFRTWPPSFRGSKPVVIERPFGDGGYVDNYGIIPLLKRRVKKIVVFINTDMELKHNTRWPLDKEVDSFLTVLFGQPVPRSLATILSPSEMLSHDRIFGDGRGQVLEKKDYSKTLLGLTRSAKLANLQPPGGGAGPVGRMGPVELAELGLDPESEYAGLIRGPVYYRDTYRTVYNRYFGVEPGHEVEILWVYNGKSNAFLDRLPADTREKLGSDPSLASFPRTATFRSGKFVERQLHEWGEAMRKDGFLAGTVKWVKSIDLDGFGMIDMTPAQINLLSALSGWGVSLLEDELLDMVPEARASVPVRPNLQSILDRTGAATLRSAFTAAGKHDPSIKPESGMSALVDSLNQ